MMDKSKGRRSLHLKSCNEEVVTVRSVRVEDMKAVKQICYDHFRSLCVAAVKYYCLAHFRDLVVLVAISKLFQPWKHVGLGVLLFLAYLFARARIEMEFYILFECPDLNDIWNYYMTDPRSHFWVAEGLRPPLLTENANKAKTPPNDGSDKATVSHENHSLQVVPQKRVLGCVGCAPLRDDETVVQLLRLVVAEDVRRMRHGSRLLAQFENFAKEKGYKQVRLYTNNLSSNHIKFIRQHGYIALQTIHRSLMRGSLIEWKKKLSDDTSFCNYLDTISCKENPKSSVHYSNEEPIQVTPSVESLQGQHPHLFQRHPASRITLLQD